MKKIETLESSLRCFTCGLISLIPFFGVPAIILANKTYFRVQMGTAGQWNAAQSYLIWGFMLACLGVLINLLAFALTILVVVKVVSDG
ncbi:hypothetical protein [Pedosphaera parvula]|uniref:DUF4190 domain-containing protein n=1 Tax=Pedosphaera parvula (strain Ellin514) TaxID=320771 RepID=B9XSX9_PEDPL|nr:hypothetical protein [Pedosphaera parvula]EEF57063.1 hypothetical protein Cflav_PD0098 [Pedosphaera parvula Ellin514]